MVTIDRAFFDIYLDAWNAHDSAAVASHMADDAIYEDVALGRVLHGPSEIASFVKEPRDHRATSGLKWCRCSRRGTITRMNGSCSGRMIASYAAFLRPAAPSAFGERQLEGSMRADGSSRIATTTTSRSCSRSLACCRLRRRSLRKRVLMLKESLRERWTT
jgi:SnoaL-like domain